MKAKKILIGTLFTSVVAVAVGAFALTPKENLMQSTASATCAKINFGMKDDNTGGVEESGFGTGYVSTYGTTYAKDTDHTSTLPGTTSGITLTKFRCTANCNQLKAGDEYTVSKVKYTAVNDHGLKFPIGTFTFTFNANVVGCDVYVVGWNEDGNSLNVNGAGAQNITKNSSVAGTIGADTLNVAYQKLTYTFESTNVLSMVFAKRGFIGHIALRLA